MTTSTALNLPAFRAQCERWRLAAVRRYPEPDHVKFARLEAHEGATQ